MAIMTRKKMMLSLGVVLVVFSLLISFVLLNANNMLAFVAIWCGMSGIFLLIRSSRTSIAPTGVPVSTEKADKRYQDTFDKVAVGLAHVGLDGRFLRVNKQLCTFLGYTEQELLEKSFQELSLPDELPDGLVFIQEALAGKNTNSYSKIKRYYHKQGHLVWAKLATTLVRNDQGQPEYFLSSVQNIADLKHTEALLQQSEEKFKIIVESVSNEVAIWLSSDSNGDILYVNQGFSKIWEQSENELYTNPRCYLDLVHPKDKHRVEQTIQNRGDQDYKIDYRIQLDKERVRYLHQVGMAILDNNGKLLYFVTSVINRTEVMSHQHLLDDSLFKLKQAYRQLQKVSRRDGLTGALNISAFKDNLDDALQHFKRYKTPSALVFIDLDRFKEINDTYGHAIGDQVLISLVNLLLRKVRRTDSVGRYGGDEFVVLLTNSNAEQATEFCQRIGTSFSVSLENEEVIDISMSTGVYALSDEIQDVKQWLQEADQEMYSNKTSEQS